MRGRQQGDKEKLAFNQPKVTLDQFYRRGKLEQVLDRIKVLELTDQYFDMDDIVKLWVDNQPVSFNGDGLLKENHPETINLVSRLLDELAFSRWMASVLFLKVTGRHLEDEEDAHALIEKLMNSLKKE